jgi:hypothetical protein
MCYIDGQENKYSLIISCLILVHASPVQQVIPVAASMQRALGFSVGINIEGLEAFFKSPQILLAHIEVQAGCQRSLLKTNRHLKEKATQVAQSATVCSPSDYPACFRFSFEH